MKAHRLRVVLIAAVVVAALAVPTVAVAGQWTVSRAIIGVQDDDRPLGMPDIGGSSIAYGQVAGSGRWALRIFSLKTGAPSYDYGYEDQDILWPAVSGDWTAWQVNGDIRAKSATGGSFPVTSDAQVRVDTLPAVSTADGQYVVWQSSLAGDIDVRGKNLGIDGTVFTIASGPGSQWAPAIHGKHVAYLDNSSGQWVVHVKTIGSSAAPLEIPNANGSPQTDVDIGDHLVAWTSLNGFGHYAIRYYDYDTGLISEGPSDQFYDAVAPHVSGDRIIYSMYNGADDDLYVYDTRIARTNPLGARLPLATTNTHDRSGAIDGNNIAYMSQDIVYFGRLAAPSISLKTVPNRIPHNGHIHLTGSISDQGHRIASAALEIEKYASGKWTKFKAITANAAGEFAYKTPHNHSKTRYRVVYNGKVTVTAAEAAGHMSTVSAVKTAWPR
jgi:hypothetical protein